MGLVISAFSLRTSAIRFALAALIDTITNTMESIISAIIMLITYENMDVRLPVVIVPSAIKCAANHERAIILAYMTNIITGLLKASHDSAFTNVL